MGDTFFRFAIKFLIGVGSALIMMLAARRMHTITKELEYYRANDTTMVALSDSTTQQFTLPQ